MKSTTNLTIQRASDELQPVRDVLIQNKVSLAKLLPKTMDIDRFFAVIGNSVKKTPALARCTPASLFYSIRQCAELGLEPDTALGHAYLIPYKDEATMIPGYKGLIFKIHQCSGIEMWAEVVYRDDIFVVERGTNPMIRHVPDLKGDRTEAAIEYVYAVARMPDGHIRADMPMTREEVERVRRIAKTDKVWSAHFAEMAKKTAIRRFAKVLPISNEVFSRLLEVDNEGFETNRVLEAGQARRTLSLNADEKSAGRSEEPARAPTPAEKPSDAYYPSEEPMREPGQEG